MAESFFDLSAALGWVSATLVAIIALAFASLFVFFSGASVLVLGRFLEFARPARFGLSALAVMALVLGVVSHAIGAPVWQLPLLELLFGAIVYGLLVARLPRRVLWCGLGAVAVATLAVGVLVPRDLLLYGGDGASGGLSGAEPERLAGGAFASMGDAGSGSALLRGVLVALGPVGALLALASWLLRGRVPERRAWLGIFVGLALLSIGFAVPQAAIFPSFVAWATAIGTAYVVGAALALAPLVAVGLLGHRIERPVEWFISLRYLVARRRQTFISIISVICVTGVALGVAVITVVLSVMNGFSRVWEDKILGTRAHFLVLSREGAYADYARVRDEVLAAPGVVGATPFIEAEAILRGDGGELEAILLKGIDPATVGEATQLRQDMIEGSLEALAPGAPAATVRGSSPGPEEGRIPNSRSEELDAEGARGSPGLRREDLNAESEKDYPGIVLGVEMADRYLLRPGDPVILISPMGGPATPLGPAPRMARFRVAGIFKSNFFQFDERFAYASLADVQDFMKIGDVASGVEVRTDDPYRSQAVADEVERSLGGLFYARDWKTFYPGFFSALKTERVMMFVLLSFIMVVAGFIIIATLIMMIMEKSRDIAILKAMGCENEGVLRVFAIQGFLIGAGGLALGLGMGLVITWNLDVIQGTVERLLGIDVLPANVYQLQQLPYDIVPWHLVLISLIAMVLSIGATLLPSWQAARVDPAEALRFE